MGARIKRSSFLTLGQLKMVFNMIGAPSGGYSGYSIGQSMLLDGSSDYLSWTPGTATDRKIWAARIMVRRHELGRAQCLMSGYIATSNFASGSIQFNSSDQLNVQNNDGTSTNFNVTTSRVFRDVGSFYDILVIFDSTQATASDRIKIFVNGVQQTSFAATSYPSLNYAVSGLNGTSTHYIGVDNTPATGLRNYANVTVSELYFIDGNAPAVADFGEFYNGTTKWRAIQPSGLTYGTNGFHLDFSNSGDLGEDQAGSNDWTVNGTPEQSSDSPTVNYATMNSLDVSSDLPPTCADGNRTVSRTTGFGAIRATIAIDPTDTDGYYWEVECNTTGVGYIGIANTKEYLNYSPAAQRGHDLEQSAMMRTANGNLHWSNADQGSYGNSTANSDRLMFCVKNGKFYIGENGTWFNSGDPDAETGEGKSGLTELVSPCVNIYDGENYTFHFNSEDWNHTAPTGAKELCAANLPEVTITDPGEHFNVLLHTGTGAELAVTGANFQPNWTWIKNRDSTDSNMLFDVIRGATEVLHSNETAAEATEAQTLKSFDSDGFTLGTDVQVNTNTEDFVSWNWKAGGTGVANNDGTISSVVSVNDDAGFSIVGFEGTGAAGTVGHGQSGALEMIWLKNRTDATNWLVYDKFNGGADYLQLNLTNAVGTSSDIWNNTDPTSALFSVGSNNASNGSSDDMIAYCFRSIPGYSKVFSYIGNGSTDGPFVYLGFKSRWVMLKRVDNISGWMIGDALRPEYNDKRYELRANDSSAEVTTISHFDILSNGFKKRYTDFNVSGGTYIGIAFAENPFGGSNIPLGLAQ